MKPKIKICGITQVDIARAFADLPIDAIGLVFYEKSPRFVDIKLASRIIAVLPPFINRVGLFVNAKPKFIHQIINAVPLDTLQFHGDETPSQCSQYPLPFLRALRIQSGTNLSQLAQNYHQASGLVLDTHCKKKFGGTGTSFDWSLAQANLPLPIILAGGLTPANVTQAITQVKPYGVDVSSGVEMQKGIKDLDKIKQFVSNVYAL